MIDNIRADSCDAVQYPHTYVWRDAGYVADRPDFAAETVTFRRVAAPPVR